MIEEIVLNQVKPLSYKVNSENKISIAGISVEDLAKKYGTPLYVICEKTIRERIKAYKKTFENSNLAYEIFYASKALNLKAICKIMASEDIGIDVVSGGELFTALSANFPKDKIIFHGNNKSLEEISMCIDNQVTIVVDSFWDIDLIKKYLGSKSCSLKVLIRITPGIECHTHEYIKTGKIDSKFGFNIDDIDSVIQSLIDLQKNIPGSKIEILGLHSHIGSQIFETIPHKDLCKVLLERYKQIKEKFGLEFSAINVGGGLGIKYLETDDPPEIENWTKVICTELSKIAKELNIKMPKIMIEPGRSLVGPAGLTIYRIGNIKNIETIRKYIAVDGGMADNTRPIMYQAKYFAEIDAKSKNCKTEKVTIAGRYCESGDVLINEIELPEAKVGDLLIIYSTGAYNYSMSSNYNRVPRPAMILVKDDKSSLILERESYEDIISKDRMPDWL